MHDNSGMTARAFWKARLCLDDQRIPVRMFAAVEDTAVHFRLLHAEDRVPVEQRMVDPVRGEEVAPEEIQRGLEVAEGVYVILTDEEREAVEPTPSRDIRVEQLVDASSLDLRWFVRSYYLGPEGDADGYFALSEALADREVFAIVRWVMRKKRYQGALVCRGGYLELITLRGPEELVEISGTRVEPRREPDPKELELARQLVGHLEGDFDPDEYRDEYRERLLELIETKASGQEVELPRRRERRAERSLIEALEASLGQGAAGG